MLSFWLSSSSSSPLNFLLFFMVDAAIKRNGRFEIVGLDRINEDFFINKMIMGDWSVKLIKTVGFFGGGCCVNMKNLKNIQALFLTNKLCTKIQLIYRQW